MSCERETILPPQPPPPLAEPPPPLPPPRILARDGFGQPVDWFMIIKLPERTFRYEMRACTRRRRCSTSTRRRRTAPVQPAVLVVGGVLDTARPRRGRYLYADSNSPTPARTPSPATTARPGRTTTEPHARQLHARHDDPDVEWAYWNDQLQGTADWAPPTCKLVPSADALPLPRAPPTPSAASVAARLRLSRCDADVDRADGAAASTWRAALTCRTATPLQGAVAYGKGALASSATPPAST